MSVRSTLDGESVNMGASSVVLAVDNEQMTRLVQDLHKRQSEARKNAHANRLRRILSYLVYKNRPKPNLNIRAEDIFSPIRNSIIYVTLTNFLTQIKF